MLEHVLVVRGGLVDPPSLVGDQTLAQPIGALLAADFFSLQPLSASAIARGTATAAVRRAEASDVLFIEYS